MDGSLQQKLNDFLKKKNLKSTRQRDVIIETFFALKGRHIRIDELLEKVKTKDSRVGYATVYRTLKLLVEAGVAQQNQFNDAHSVFEIETNEHHDHLICSHCGTIVEFEDEDIEWAQEQIAKSHGFILTAHKMELYGICASCQLRQK